MTSPALSVIIPIYKVEAFLPACLDSLLKQQNLAHAEFILVNDGSPDGCGAICDEYARKDTRFRVLHKSNGGVSSARNSGLEISRGRYISFLDGDDFTAPNTYADNLAILEKDPEIELLQFPYIFEYGRSESQPTFGKMDRTIIGWTDFFCIYQNEGMTICNLWGNKIIRRDLIGNTLFRTDLQGGEDGVFLLDILPRLKVARLSSAGVLYYVYRQGSYVNSPRTTKAVLDELYLAARRYDIACKLPTLESACERRIYVLKQQYLNAAALVAKASELNQIRKLLNDQPYPPLLAFIKQLQKERKVDALKHLGMALFGMHRFAWLCRFVIRAFGTTPVVIKR